MSRRLRGVVVFTKAEGGPMRWHRSAGAKGLDAAQHYLLLIASREQADRLVDELRAASVSVSRAEDVLKATRRKPLPADDPEVRRQLEKIDAGKRLRPVLVVTLPNGQDDIANGLHRVSAAFHRNPSTPVHLIHAGSEQKGAIVSKTKKSKLAKSAIADPGARRAIELCAQQLDAYASDPSVAGLVSRLRASIESPVDHAPGEIPTMTMTKVEKALTKMQELRKRDVDPTTTAAVLKGTRHLQLEYLHQASPNAAAVWEAYRADAAKKAA